MRGGGARRRENRGSCLTRGRCPGRPHGSWRGSLPLGRRLGWWRETRSGSSRSAWECVRGGVRGGVCEGWSVCGVECVRGGVCEGWCVCGVECARGGVCVGWSV